MKKGFEIILNVPEDFKPGDCECCPMVNDFGDPLKEHCDLDPKDENPLCLLTEVKEIKKIAEKLGL